MKKHKFKLLGLFILGCILTVLFFANLVYAQTKSNNFPIAPEPGSIALISTGIFGWMVRFARRRFWQFKRFFDILVSAFGLVIAAPIVAATGIIIKIVSPGSIFFKQKRVGWEGKIFDMYKLRTMKLNAE